MIDRAPLDRRQTWILRLWSVLLVAGSWGLAVGADPAVTDGRPSLDSVLTVLVSLGLGVWAILIVPIDKPWLRWLVNPLVVSLPVLALIDNVTSWL